MQSRMTNPLMIVPDALRAVHALGASANKGAQRKQRVDLGDDKRSPRVGLRPPSMRSSLRPLRGLRGELFDFFSRPASQGLDGLSATAPGA
jgi:hypothetical protein